MTLLKSIVVLLALANVGYFLWTRGIAHRADAGPAPAAATLKLASEVPGSQRGTGARNDDRASSSGAGSIVGAGGGVDAPGVATPGRGLGRPAHEREALHQRGTFPRRVRDRARREHLARRRLRSAAAGRGGRGLGGRVGLSADSTLPLERADAEQAQGRRDRGCAGDAGPQRELGDLARAVRRSEARANPRRAGTGPRIQSGHRRSKAHRRCVLDRHRSETHGQRAQAERSAERDGTHSAAGGQSLPARGATPP